MTILSRIIFPQDEQLPRRDLYFRLEGAASLKDGALFLTAGAKVRFNTYFNAFFYPKYLRYTCVSSVCVVTHTTGRIIARLVYQGKNMTQIVSEVKFSGRSYHGVLPTCQLEDLPKEGALFLEVEALSSEAVLFGGWYGTERVPLHQVKVAVIICTFHREDYIKKNLERMQKYFWGDAQCPAALAADVFIIDNGCTLPPQDGPNIWVFPNRNCGGSGGFTRGLIEAYRRKEVYTHVLFMDDDISFDIETLVKTIQLLKFARKMEQPLCIGGQMLLEDRVTIQYEAGASYRKGRAVSFNRGLDLAFWENLLRNEVEQQVQYNAWWYCCFPLDVVDKAGLPLPLFIKIDDIEYGLRLHPKVLLMNGIGVWHMAFEEKYSPHLEYYIKRNELVVSTLYHSGDGFFLSVWKLVRASAKAILIGKPETIHFVLLAYQDFLQGPDFFLNTDEELLNQQLLEERDCAAQGNRCCAVLSYLLRAVPILVKFLKRSSSVGCSYRQRLSELTALSFWCDHLRIRKLEEMRENSG